MAASEQIKANGFAGASLSSIAASCGVTKGALAHHFPTKVAFAEGIAEYFLGALETARREALIAWPDGGIRALVGFIVQVGNAMAMDPRCSAAVVLFTDPSAPERSTDRILMAWTECIRGFLSTAVVNGEADLPMPLDQATGYLVTGMIGALVYMRRAARPKETERMRFVRLAFTALGVHDPDSTVTEVMEHARRIDDLNNLPPLRRDSRP